MSEVTPSSDESEKGILSCFFLDRDLLEDAAMSVHPDWFFSPPNKVVYEAMLDMRFNKIPLDLVSINVWFNDHLLMDSVGGPSELAQLYSYVPTPTQYGYYKTVLKDKFLLRRLIQSNNECNDKAYTCPSNEIPTLIAQHASTITSYARDSIPQRRSMSEIIEDWMENWHETFHGERSSGVSSRWDCFNLKCGGIKPGYTVVSGKRASGKSCLAYNMVADYCIKHNLPGIIKNYEMPVDMTINRLIADIGGVPGEYLFYPDRFKPNDQIMKAIQRARDILAQSKLEIIHDVTMDIESVIDLARRKKANEGDCLLAIDYLQIAPDPKRRKKDQNREQDVAKNSAVCRSASKELAIPIIVLSQLNADGTTRESAAVEQDADDVYRIDSEHGVYIHKQRNGPSGEFLPLFLNGPLFRFQRAA